MHISEARKSVSDDFIKLSVCIPIYNCGAFIGEALDSILPQTNKAIEVVVFDGGSTDNTEAVMNSYVEKWSNLKFIRADSRGGIDADLISCVGHASGEFCWLFSGDDVMRAGAMSEALVWLKKDNDIYICEHTICDKMMNVLRANPVLSPNKTLTANLNSVEPRHEWFGRAMTTEAFFSFLSGLIVRRSKWLSGEVPVEFSRSCWGHVARFFGLMKSGLVVCYVAETWLDQRGENDSFADKGVINRLKIGVEGYQHLANHFFGYRSVEAFHVRRVLKSEFIFLTMLSHKILCAKKPEQEDADELARLVHLLYCDNSPLDVLKKLLFWVMPYWVVSACKLAYKPIKFIRRGITSV